MIYIKIDDNTFYDDAIVLVRSFPEQKLQHIKKAIVQVIIRKTN